MSRYAAGDDGAFADLYAVLAVSVPPATDDRAREAYAALAKAFPGYDPRR